MENNGVLTRLRYALNLPDTKVAAMIRQAGIPIDDADVPRMLKNEFAEDFLPCPNRVLGGFLDVLIRERRGPPPPGAERAPDNENLTNNDILKKLRVAFKLSEDDVERALALGDMRLSKPELRALFRSPGQTNYRACGDQVLRKFLVGLTKMQRG
jgi:uncharacterized protein YehS (DUF1456 family)